MSTIGDHARLTFTQIEESGPAHRPLDFPPPLVRRGIRTNAFVVVNPATDQREMLRGIIYRAPIVSSTTHNNTNENHHELPQYAYYPVRQLQEAIYGSVWCCLVLRRSSSKVACNNSSTTTTATAAVKKGHTQAPATPTAATILWEVTRSYVAIKMVEWARVQRLRGRHIEDPIKEIAAMQLLGSGNPHVLGSTEVLQDDNYLYSVMRYCRGGDLFGVVVKYSEENAVEGGEEGRMPEPMVRYWFRQILKGLHYMQSKGVCHRDLSLENILVDDQHCLIIDMGMCLREPYSDRNNPARVTDVDNGTIRRLMTPQGVCGKHNYMSPEVFQNVENFDGFAIDLWAAGVILYIMLTGFPPYDQADMVDERFSLIVTGQLAQQLEAWDVPISRDAGDLLQRMLMLDPRQRLTLAQVMCHPWVRNPDVAPPTPAKPEGWRRT